MPIRDHIVGREKLLDELARRLISGQSTALSADGLPGVGKTTMALLLAYDARVRAHFTDGVLWAGLGTQPDIAGIQAQWAQASSADLSGTIDPTVRQSRLSAAVSDRRVLVVIDDAWTSEAAETLRLSGPRVAHVLTTRNEDIARAFGGAASAVKVPVLDDATAWGLLQRLAPEACAADPAAARRLADAVGGLPLAVELVGGYLAAPEHWRFSDLSQAALGDLGDPRRRLALAQARLGDTGGAEQTLEAVIRLSVDDLLQLGEAGDRANRAFYALAALAPKPATFDLAAAAAVADADASTLALLAGRNLLDVGAGEWMAVHQVVHDVARMNLPPEAVERHQTYYLNLLNEDRQDWQRIERAFPQAQHAWRGLPDDDDRVIEFVWAMRVYFVRRGLGAKHLAWAESRPATGAPPQ